MGTLLLGIELMPYRTEVHFINAGHPLYQYCSDTCLESKNLYNYANYLIRQQFFYLETFLPYDGKVDSLYFQVKHHETYKALPAQTAQQTLRKTWDPLPAHPSAFLTFDIPP
jgi:putative transposase